MAVYSVVEKNCNLCLCSTGLPPSTPGDDWILGAAPQIVADPVLAIDIFVRNKY